METEKEKNYRNENNRIQTMKRRADMSEDEKIAFRKHEAERKRLRRLALKSEKSAYDYFYEIVVKVSKSAESKAVRKQKDAKQKAIARVEAKPAIFWISNLLIETVVNTLPLDDFKQQIKINRKFWKSQVDESLSKYKKFAYEINEHLKKISVESLNEKCKKLPSKMQKMYHLLKNEIGQGEAQIDEIHLKDLDLKMIGAKYNSINKKILNVMKQLRDFLNIHGFKLEMDNSKIPNDVSQFAMKPVPKK